MTSQYRDANPNGVQGKIQRLGDSMKNVVAMLVACLAWACNPVQQSPTAPTPLPVQAPVIAPTVPTGQPFSVSIAAASGGSAYPGSWGAVVRVTANTAVVSPERLASVRLTCNGRTTVRDDAGFGTLILTTACDFPTPGAYSVQVVATGVAGFQTTAAMSVLVVYPPIERIEVFYSVDVFFSANDWTDVWFGTRTVDGAEYRWDFGDDSHDATERLTLLPHTRHRFTRVARGSSNERRVTVTAIASDGRTLATGAVVGRW